MIDDHLGVSAPEPPEPSYEELAALVVGLAARVETLEAENAELRRRLGMNSTNSSVPPSQDSIETKAKRRADRSSRQRSKDRKPGGQPGRQGSGLVATATPDRTQTLPPPGQCAGCGGDLAGAADAGMSWAQVWDILPIVLEKVHYLLPRRRCGCGKITTAAAPFGAAGTVVYGPNLNAAAILLASEGNVPIERTAMLIQALTGVAVSTGFVARAVERFAQRLADAGFDEAMRIALRTEDVLCADETPTNVVRADTDAHASRRRGRRTRSRCAPLRRGWCGTRRSAPDPKRPLRVWACWRATPATWSATTTPAGTQFDAQLAGVQQCAAHLIRHAKAVLALHPTQQQWAGQVITVLCEAAAAVTAAVTDGCDQLDPQLLADLRRRYDAAVAWGITPTSTATGPRATTPDTPSPPACVTRPSKSSPSPETSPCPGQTTPVSRPSKVPNDIRPSPATGTH